jgi:DNA-binding Lrp family transcriptional regulator
MKLPPGARLLRGRRQVGAVSSPLRIELLEHLRLAGRASVADLARLTGRPATALHYHVNLLHEAGLLRVAQRRPAGKREESLYALAAESFALAANDTFARRAAARTVGATLRMAQREAARALASGAGANAGAARRLHCRRLRAPLGREAQAELNRLLDAVERVFEKEVRRRSRRGGRVDVSDGDVLALTFVLAPGGRAKEG